MEGASGKQLLRIDFKFRKIAPDEARTKQYELLKDERIWRAFLNGYTGNGYVVFDEEALPKDELLSRLREFEPEVTAIRRLTLGELIESSYSWNNILGSMEP